MLNLLGLNKLRKSTITRFFALTILIPALAGMSLGLPDTSRTAEAQTCFPSLLCPNRSFNVAGLVSRIDVTWNGGHRYRIKFNLAPGVSTTGSCGDGSATWIRNYDASGTDCGSGSTAMDDVFAVNITVGTCSTTFTTSYKVYAYDSGGNSKRVHSSVTINKSDFTTVGQTITSYAPVPGC
jgi:hypothetical protein